jgi:hypothetical protein
MITRGAAAIFWRRCTPARQTHRHVIAVASRFRVENPKLPFPEIHSSTSVEKRLPRTQLKIPQDCPMHPRPAEKTGELLTVNVETETEALPAQKGTEDLVETGEI